MAWPNPKPLFTRRHIKTHRRHERHPPRKFAISLYNTKISLASSGHSSPNSSITSPIFSSNGSSSSRSPASSQNSFTEGSPYPSHLFRRQPRIQVASLLADPFTRLVICFSIYRQFNANPTELTTSKSFNTHKKQQNLGKPAFLVSR